MFKVLICWHIVPSLSDTLLVATSSRWLLYCHTFRLQVFLSSAILIQTSMFVVSICSSAYTLYWATEKVGGNVIPVYNYASRMPFFSVHFFNYLLIYLIIHVLFIRLINSYMSVDKIGILVGVSQLKHSSHKIFIHKDIW